MFGCRLLGNSENALRILRRASKGDPPVQWTHMTLKEISDAESHLYAHVCSQMLDSIQHELYGIVSGIKNDGKIASDTHARFQKIADVMAAAPTVNCL